MPRFALALMLVFFALAFGLRSLLHWRRTGSTGFRGLSGAPGSLEWSGGVLFIVALVGVALAPVLALLGRGAPWTALDRPALHLIGGVLGVAGLAGTLWAQLAMGTSWRIGVDPSERTALVTRGPFRLVRNPIFSAMVLATIGEALLVPGPMAALALVLLVAALEIHVRTVEEPYLVRTHGRDYLAYAARTGRFVPGVGRLAAGGLAGRAATAGR